MAANLDSGPMMSGETQDIDTQRRISASNARHGRLPTLISLALVTLVGILMAILLISSQQQPANTGVFSNLSANSGRLAADVASRSVLHWQAADFALSNLAGQEIRLSDFRGRVVFLNFWETWCAPCRTEMPEFAAFRAEQDPSQGAVVLTINGGQNEEQILEFYAELGIAPLPTLLDTGGRVNAQYSVLQLPQTFILDRDGVVRARALGTLSLEQLRAHLADLAS